MQHDSTTHSVFKAVIHSKSSVQARENIPPMLKFKMLSSTQDLTSNHVGEKQPLYHLYMRTYAMLTLTKIPILLVPQRRRIFLLYSDS